jgi:hypothetical protein
VTGETGEGDDLTDITVDFLLDPTLKVFANVEMPSKVYEAEIRRINQRVVDRLGRQLKTKAGKPVVDTLFDFIFPERGHTDMDYVEQLVSEKILDDEFVRDVLMVDFTRPIFSDSRCGLLRFAPDLESDKIDLDTLREGFSRNLEAASPRKGSPEAELLTNLRTPSQGKSNGAHKKRVDAFLKACGARPKEEFMVDVMKIASHRRSLARKLPLLEFPETMPVDDLRIGQQTRFDPETCVVRE